MLLTLVGSLVLVMSQAVATGISTRVSVDKMGTEANTTAVTPSLSADGWFVVFISGTSNLVAEDTNGQDDIFVHQGSPHSKFFVDKTYNPNTLATR